MKPELLREPGRRAADFLGLNASMIAMIVLVVFLGLGEKMAERFLPLYLVALGGSTIAVGSLNAMDNLLSALYSFPGGWLSDRLGYKRALILFTLAAMVGYLLVILVPAWWAVFVGAVFFISWTAITLPAVMSMVSKAVPKAKRTMGVTVHSFVRRIPMALGPVIGGALIGVLGRVSGIRVAFIAAFALGAAAILFVRRFMKDEPPERRRKSGSLLASLRFISPPLRNLLVSDILIRFAEQIPYAFVVLWVVDENGQSALRFGILTTIEMVTAMLVYVPVAYLADRSTKKPFVLITFGFFTLFPLVLLGSRTFGMLALAFVIRGLKEFGEPTRKALIMDLAPEDAKALTFGAYYLIRDVVVSVAALSSAFLWNVSPATNFLAAAGCGLLGTAWFALFGRDAGKA
ncbi:MAG: MFS transporter [Spirochaetes bacterium RBG_13_68_11]|nr:MAG: MFS transporter [Spirochaetes bacterium RBG_13_68_11]